MKDEELMNHLYIPDTQIRPGVPIHHLEALGNYIVAKQPKKIIMAGDWADMHSLSSYDVGKKAHEGARVVKDIKASREAMETLLKPIWDYNQRQRCNKKAQYKPEMHLTLGNHENRIDRHVESNPVLEGSLSVDDLGYEDYGWKVYPFLHIVNIDDVNYSHYFINPHSLRKTVVGGTIDTKLKNLGFTFTMGHQQTLQFGVHFSPDGSVRQGLVAGSFYMHDEPYMGSQGNISHWRGCILKQEVRNGRYDPQFLSLDYFLREWI